MVVQSTGSGVDLPGGMGDSNQGQIGNLPAGQNTGTNYNIETRLWATLSVLWWPGGTIYYNHRKRLQAAIARYYM